MGGVKVGGTNGTNAAVHAPPCPHSQAPGSTKNRWSVLMGVSWQNITAVLLVLPLGGCGDLYRYFASGPVGWAIEREIRDRAATEVHLEELTNFRWDEVFIFEPYTPRCTVCNQLDLSASDCVTAVTDESTDDGDMFLAFRSNGRIVHTEMHFHYHGDFTPVPTKQPLKPEDAVFRVVVNGRAASGDSWYKLVPKYADRADVGRSVEPVAWAHGCRRDGRCGASWRVSARGVGCPRPVWLVRIRRSRAVFAPAGGAAHACNEPVHQV